jgi:hypothetical protein
MDYKFYLHHITVRSRVISPYASVSLTLKWGTRGLPTAVIQMGGRHPEACLTWDPLWCASMWWRDRREREAEGLSIIKRGGTGDSGVGEEQPVVSSLPCHLRPWEDSNRSLCLYSWPILPTKAAQQSLVWDAAWYHVDVQRLHRAGTYHH